MVAAIIIAVAVMILASNPIGDFIERHPTVKMLALTFLILVGAALVADGFGYHIPRGFLYFAMAFSGLVEALNMVARHRQAKKAERKRLGA
jgi:predicted tellurium resistance membrane protein TerC